jgi:hypothetical protein
VTSISDIVRRLQQPNVDMFEQRRLREEITHHGAAAVHDLLRLVLLDPTLVEGLLRDSLAATQDEAGRSEALHELERHIMPAHDVIVRRACMRLLAGYFPNEASAGIELGEIFQRDSETREIRLEALRAAARFRPIPQLGWRLAVLLRDRDREFVTLALAVLPAYQEVLRPVEIVRDLRRLLGPDIALELRCSAIELLGRFGEIDEFERVCLLPLTDEREQRAVQAMVGHLLHKPRNVLALSPRGFEGLVARLLEKMRYEDVTAQEKGSHDQGVDVTAWFVEHRLKGPERVKMIGQCKRYSSEPIGREVVATMVDSLRQQQAGRGLIITTSLFAPAALELARAHQQIELVDGRQLQELLNTHFAGVYRIGELSPRVSRPVP